MFFLKFLVLFFLIPALMIALASATGAGMRVVLTYLLFPIVLLAIVIVNFLREDHRS